MRQFPPNVPPRVSTLTAMTIGYALIADFTYLEQNAIGSWFVVIGEILKANATYGLLLEGRAQDYAKINEQFKDINLNEINAEYLQYIQNTIIKMNETIEKLKKEMDKSTK